MDVQRWAEIEPLYHAAVAKQAEERAAFLAAACGVTVGTQPADSGFWMLKEYGNLTTSDVMVRVNLCRFSMALCGLAILLIVEAFR